MSQELDIPGLDEFPPEMILGDEVYQAIVEENTEPDYDEGYYSPECITCGHSEDDHLDSYCSLCEEECS